MMQTLYRALRNPVDAGLRLIGRLQPALLWQRHSRLARTAGLDRLYLVLSFDCDAPDDAEVALEMDARLRDLGVLPLYAVPGELLEKAADVYTRLFARGAEFLNHGYVWHTFWNQERRFWESSFFYDQLPPERVRQDVQEGHQAVVRVLGKPPAGFRTPHFGTFQSPAQLRFLHGVLGELGYSYSSSTMPAYAFKLGPRFERFGLREFPVTGAYSRPLNIQDSWGYYASPDRYLGPDDYLREARAMSRYCKEHEMVGILNYYADPSHVWDQPTFYEAVKLWREVAVPSRLDTL